MQSNGPGDHLSLYIQFQDIKTLFLSFKRERDREREREEETDC
jgi:hypothetical protein